MPRPSIPIERITADRYARAADLAYRVQQIEDATEQTNARLDRIEQTLTEAIELLTRLEAKT